MTLHYLVGLVLCQPRVPQKLLATLLYNQKALLRKSLKHNLTLLEIYKRRLSIW